MAPQDGKQKSDAGNRGEQGGDHGGGVQPEALESAKESAKAEPRWWEVGGTGVSGEAFPDSVFSIAGLCRPLSTNTNLPMCLQKQHHRAIYG